MWRLLKERETGFEAWYFSYSQKMASYHLNKLKSFIEVNPFYTDLVDLKPTAESVLAYTWDGKKTMTVRPAGLLTHTRGIHAEHIYVDDPFQSEDSSKIEPVKILKINEVVKGAITPMVKRGGTCRITTTPQSESDFIFDADMQAKFKVWITPAIVNEAKKQALWPEWKPYNELIEIRKLLGTTLFNKEYQVMPATAANSYLDREQLLKCVSPDLQNYRFEVTPPLFDEYVIAGLDIGKKRHPSHLAIFIREPAGTDISGNEIFTYKQIYSFWMDHWDYGKQVEYCNLACDYFGITRLTYDNTRGEFEGFMERNELHDAMVPMSLNMHNQNKMAAYMGMLVDNERVELVNDDRQYNQMLAVTGELKAVENKFGHGDSFWSNGMALWELASPEIRIRSLYN